MRRTATGLSAGLLAMVAVALAAGAARAATPAVSCPALKNPFSHTRAAVEACGRPTFGLERVDPLPGGGKSYVYRIDGRIARMRVAPPGFDALHATARQLDEYGLPSRPTDSVADYDAWLADVADLHMVTPPRFLMQTHVRNDTRTSGIWAGYAVTGASGSFGHAETRFYTPSFGASRCSNVATSIWAGLGGVLGPTSGKSIAQDGTEWNPQEGLDNQAWWEIYPDIEEIDINFWAHTGYRFDVSVRRIFDHYRFFWHDFKTGTSTSLDYYTDTVDDRSAEAIVERPEAYDYATKKFVTTNLANFGTINFDLAEANGYGMQTWDPATNRHGIWMVNPPDSDHVLAQPSAIGSDGAFSVRHVQCN